MPICVKCRKEEDLVESTYKCFIICDDCAREEIIQARANLCATLTPGQRELLDVLDEKKDNFNSMAILAS